jgi:hypothetical protein
MPMIGGKIQRTTKQGHVRRLEINLESDMEKKGILRTQGMLYGVLEQKLTVRRQGEKHV